MPIDLAVLIAAAAGLGAVLLYQAIAFRRVKDGALFNVLIASMVCGLLLCAAVGLWFVLAMGLLLIEAMVLVVGALLLTGLVSFVYILCLFGPCTTSVRIRLLREIGQDSKGITREALAACYNDRVILDLRLERLMGSGDLALRGDQYVLVRRRNVFFFMECVADAMKTFIHKG
jgi:hypothetical protein